ncbi:hypothetical protein I5E97_14805 [Proteus hauseri]|uniref:hypothetical protein n=1 Tax=Proteus cibi TaxID=2050966 RepID=UPI0003C626C1|nr:MULTISPECIES: hypothetical protein [Proteus]EST58564.1 hypothetical protein K151_1320 [Proteus hauseri ZMd44]MBG6032304.1 hypothetical protein [Proteus hauseri]MBS6208587.1 hypothetical protein [Proteus hauseri]
MITSQQAQDIVLNHCHSSPYDELFTVYFCELSPKQDFWIIRCNSERYVIYNQLEHCYVGINAYLVDTSTGKIDIVGSGESVEDFLQDKYDLQRANGYFYVLSPSFTKENKQALINFKQWLACGYSEIILLLSSDKNKWFTGSYRTLQHIQIQLKAVEIDTKITLMEKTDDAVVVESNIWFEKDIKESLNKYINKKQVL